jgi:hypothetical protein
MLKTITQLTALAGVLASLPGIAKMGTANNQETGVNSATTAQAAHVLGLLSGKGGDLNMGNAAALLSGMSDTQSTEKAASPVPKRPMTLIRAAIEDAESNELASSSVEELPPDANAIAVDGRLQVYYPAGKSHH